MIDLVKNEDDMDTIIEAYYNFKGHNTIFSNLMIDNLVRASVSVKKPQKVFDIFAYHHYLLYYPHTKTINLLLDFFITNNQSGSLNKYLEII